MSQIKADLARITDVFGGADGGADFAQFKVFIEDFEQRAADGDAAAVEVLKVVARFRRLIDVATKR